MEAIIPPRLIDQIGAGLARRQKVDGHSGPHLRHHALCGIGREAERGHYEGAVGDYEGALSELTFTAQHHVAHLDHLVDVGRLEERGPDRLGGTHHGGVGGVDIQLPGAVHLAGDHRAHKEVNVLKGVDQAGEVIEILASRMPVGLGLVVEHENSRARSSEMHLLVGQLDGPALVNAVPYPRLGGHLDRSLHQRARKAEPLVVVHPPAGGGNRLDKLGDRIAHPHFLQKPEGGLEHFFHLRFGEWAVGAARESRPYRTLALFQPGDARGDPGGPSS